MSEEMEPTQLQPSRTAAASHHTNQPFLPSFGTLTVITFTMSPFEGGCGFTLYSLLSSIAKMMLQSVIT
jgi:hypothetical protein